jgi:hypothetical protein
MSHKRPEAPPVRNDGFGGKGDISNTAYPTVNEAGPAEAGGYGTRWEEEAAAANEAVDRQDGIER